MTAIRHVVFDLGNVLLHWEPERPYRRLIPDDAARERFLSEICNAEWLKPIDRGQSWKEAEEDLIARFPEDADMIRAFRQYWHDMVPYALGETVVVLEELIEKGVDVTALSNIPIDTYQECFPRFGFLKLFRGITASGEVRMAKPDPDIYHHHTQTWQLDPKATLFFDDMPANIATARQIGWQAERFVDMPTMRADLARHGIEIGKRS